jgi:uncharacterized membrane protein
MAGERRDPSRPDSPVERPTLIRASDVVAWLLIVGMWVHLGLAYGDLPDQIPHHFDASGAPDRWGGKIILIYLAGLSTALFALFTFLLRRPDLWNVPRSDDPVQTARILAITDHLVRLMRLLVTATFAYVQMIVIRIGRGEAASLGWPFVLLVIGGVAAPIIWYFGALRRARR